MANIVNAGLIALVAGFAVVALVGAVNQFTVVRRDDSGSAAVSHAATGPATPSVPPQGVLPVPTVGHAAGHNATGHAPPHDANGGGDGHGDGHKHDDGKGDGKRDGKGKDDDGHGDGHGDH